MLLVSTAYAAWYPRPRLVRRSQAGPEVQPGPRGQRPWSGGVLAHRSPGLWGPSAKHCSHPSHELPNGGNRTNESQPSAWVSLLLYRKPATRINTCLGSPGGPRQKLGKGMAEQGVREGCRLRQQRPQQLASFRSVVITAQLGGSHPAAPGALGAVPGGPFTEGTGGF